MVGRINTPVVLTVFNRPELTKQVFEQVAKARPARLFIVGDAPRPHNPSDFKKCQAARAIIEQIDWECEVKTNFSKTNLGPRRRISSGLDWVFNEVEEAIILEDDCLPHPTFFNFCEELLRKYKDNAQVALISGTNFLPYRLSPYSYFFSRYPLIWGWATWRRFWKHYDVEMKEWPELRDSGWLEGVLGKQNYEYWYWRKVFDAVYRGEINTWDYQLVFAMWRNNALAVIPSVNLVSNTGFGAEAFHTKRRWHKFANLKRRAMDFPLSHPPDISRNAKADEIIAKYTWTPFRPFLIRAMLFLIYRLRRAFYELID